MFHWVMEKMDSLLILIAELVSLYKVEITMTSASLGCGDGVLQDVCFLLSCLISRGN